MKATKFLPLALCALMLTPAAFADPATSASSTMTLTVTPFIDIQVNNTAIQTSASVNADYSQATLSTPFNPVFNVINNQYGRTVILSAKCPTDASPVEALGGSETAPVLAFSNTSTTRKATSSDVSDAISASPAIANNKNVIAFAFAPTCTPSEGATAEPTAAFNSNKITYTLTNGKYAFNYLANTQSSTGTFSTHDENGTYQCTLTMTAGAQL